MVCDISRCRSLCCRNCAVLTESETSKLIKEVKEKYNIELEHKKFFKKVQGEHGIYYAIKMIRGQCIFLNREKRCRIYECRPTLCELYPVINIDTVDENCPEAGNIPGDILLKMKRRYSEEINENIKAEQIFLFI